MADQQSLARCGAGHVSMETGSRLKMGSPYHFLVHFELVIRAMRPIVARFTCVRASIEMILAEDAGVAVGFRVEMEV